MTNLTRKTAFFYVSVVTIDNTLKNILIHFFSKNLKPVSPKFNICWLNLTSDLVKNRKLQKYSNLIESKKKLCIFLLQPEVSYRWN